MDPSRLAPETPRRHLLKRINRRSSILPSHDPTEYSSASTSVSSTVRASRRASLISDNAGSANRTPEAIREDENEVDLPDDHNNNESYDVHAEDENGEEAAWAEVDELMDALQRRNQDILELEKKNSELQRELQAEREKTRTGRGDRGGEGGLTRAAAIKLEREFLSQEMILKGLQRDNEDKTIEVEGLRRRMKVMSDFLAKQYGEDDWEAVVHGSVAAVPLNPVKEAPSSPEKEPREFSAVARVLSAVPGRNASPRAQNKGRFAPTLGSDAEINPFSPSKMSPSKTMTAINNDDVVIPALARMQTPLASPTKMYASATAGRSSLGNEFTVAHNDESFEAETDEVEAALPTTERATGSLDAGHHASKQAATAAVSGVHAPGPTALNFDPEMLMASIESVRLLIQGFERNNAMRRAELQDTIERAVEAERRAEKLKADAASAALAPVATTATS
ncbi:hypothetical protein BCV70DRAFT_197558 [Testicularia cyperi]|uniref:Uncharacterized protein n=1 Tax=Testicularia cyperi TaxID=1882483 RepID=A0A317XYZ1_9BASI|nr:hypothetical protein BCV70DRAFT_197558 [Testicularia cyperi]